LDWDDYHDRLYHEITGPPSTRQMGLNIWRAYRAEQAGVEPEPSLADLVRADSTETPLTSPVEPLSAPQSIGTPRSHQAGSFERSKPRSQELIDRMAAEAPHHLQRKCKKCEKFLPIDAPRHQKYHKNCEEAVRKARYRARLKAKKEELEQMLGLRPIEQADGE
jgi:hypothetical protein